MRVAGFLPADRDGTSGGRSSRVSSERQAWGAHHLPLRLIRSNKAGYFCLVDVGHSSLVPKANDDYNRQQLDSY